MEYWDGRFAYEGKIWGDIPSKSATLALSYFKDNSVRTILIPGAGYGRNSKLFSKNGIKVTGIEISERALEIAREYNPEAVFYHGSVLNMPYSNDLYDAIYCFNVLHLLLEKERTDFIKSCQNQLKINGFAFFVVFSEKEKSYGKGKKVEENTFESKPGRPTHYFTEDDLKQHFRDFSIIETGIVQDEENHGALGYHTHVLRYILAQKMANQENF